MVKRILRFLKKLAIRLYALLIMLAVIGTAYVAISYLVRAVFTPTHVPAWFVAWQGSLEADALREAHVAGVTGPAARAPLSHYHGVDRWFHPDPMNGCTTSGCHSPLPHAASKELRAFANLHATFLACEMCHAAPSSLPMPATWVDLTTGETQSAPATLQLMNLMEVEADKIQSEPEAVHDPVVRLLRQAIDAAGGDPLLEYLRVQIETSEPGSPVWRHSMAELAEELPNHARGEYGGKIEPAPGGVTGILSRAELAEATRRYLAAAPEAPDRAAAKKQIHAGIVAKPEGCLACHGPQEARLDFAALGYSPRRVGELVGARVASLMEQIQQGQPFSLRGIVGGER